MHRLSYLIVLGLLAAARAQAAVYTVNSNNDLDDGACTTMHCSLREAIRASNTTVGIDDIRFNIPPGGHQIISPASAYPSLTDTVRLDGTTQPGFAGTPIIELRGSGAGAGVNGLHVQAGGCLVKGLAIHSFSLDGILVTGAGSNTLSVNYLGPDSAGFGMGNGVNGIRISDSSNNRVEDSILSANDANGALITGGAALSNVLVGNKIGTSASGGPLGNTQNGVLVQGGASLNRIGDTAAGDGNTIAFNGLAGVRITSGTKNSIKRNSIHSNANIGIDLGGVGVTLNDLGDPDVGANNLQNFPLLRNARQSGFFTLMDWRLFSTPSTAFTIEFFSNPSCDPSAHGEGQNYLGQSSSTTDPTGFTPVISVVLPLVPVGWFITGTATDPNGNTSELAYCQTVAP